MHYLFSFIAISFFEFIPNFLALLGISGAVYVNKILKQKLPFTVLVTILGATLSTGTIVLLENTKLTFTTLPPTSQSNFLGYLTFTGVFVIASLFMFWFFSRPVNNPKSDIAIGIILALLLSLYEFVSAVQMGDLAVASIGRMISHTLAFVIAFPLTLVILRKAVKATDLHKVALLTLYAAAIMTLLITLIDYTPFLK
ncbi:hypothetical protein CO112_01575 [Candidatus Dojkabacteria bacterium CG_4_9_14_3_um_filter_150_Dojkabacteria_WS6_41_13]|uniref:Uncharacterized protein n=1 Tax=Candidatus Dojkabacteria bacterium CG_4_10_14_0_2_um_filter_Dojkabacteria_WS6_41_15 TaxID=2014249 RepID=A0A2M7W2Q0_9BACT|nr:MAG: hypothetical protein COZ14_02640 [Candidatus Dojkabacteria bacterium CG_4_10_14_3_um_filter_Dojkabacteria_WS6_41_9]PJA15141.1 MAG: hypothetical protein COX64_01115 [Candidatus Dojkabacteria bacterium CG_4_10_14_0_2_um_filter_Dojkabacteria_WS6_41_15]PJB23047.1 MAG: hypothetical protein CO112_01575 [Candidatus Dojkabacteria bacterium CG_4_9_14_3_um_filter_150_Dojkabacteria_WS6_41_13]